MSPAPARTSHGAIVAAGRHLLEQEGLDAVVMGRVAAMVGVRGPSLYKHVASRTALIRAIAEDVRADLEQALGGAMTTADPLDDLRAAAMSYRAFVHRHPNGYALLFAALPPDARPDPEAAAAVGIPIVRAMEQIGGEGTALEAARTLVAWAHGFVSMELAGAFRLGGDVDAAYVYGIEAILAGVRTVERPPSG